MKLPRWPVTHARLEVSTGGIEKKHKHSSLADHGRGCKVAQKSNCYWKSNSYWKSQMFPEQSQPLMTPQSLLPLKSRWLMVFTLQSPPPLCPTPRFPLRKEMALVLLRSTWQQMLIPGRNILVFFLDYFYELELWTLTIFEGKSKAEWLLKGALKILRCPPLIETYRSLEWIKR